MVRAGLGDLLSQRTALVDWRLAGLVQGTHYCPAVAELICPPIHGVMRVADALGHCEEAAIHYLTEALILSGFTMVMAGQSSPASGAEHLISHYWEMAGANGGRVVPLHGAQVGVSCILTADLMRRLAAMGVGDLPGPSRGQPDSWEEAEAVLEARHGSLWPKVREEARSKHRGSADRARRFAVLKERWAEIRETLETLCPEPASLQDALHRAGAPTTPADLGMSVEEVEQALLGAREIRGRYTVLDLAAEVGLLDGWARETAERFGATMR
jgi:glycerol-1-phosphate dehydrogenase [NAD(P)+]